MTYDTERQVTVLFGGCEQNSCYSSPDSYYAPATVWEWDGASWTERCTSSPCSDETPAPRSRLALAYDSDRQQVLLAGGHRGLAGGCYEQAAWTCTDTWEWNGQMWGRVSTAGPGARQNTSLAGDNSRRRVILFGGSNSGAKGDTWEWNGGARDRPAHVLEINLAATGYGPWDVDVREVSSTWVAGGSGYDAAGAEVLGVEILVWDSGAWRSAAKNTGASIDSLAAITWSTQTDPRWSTLSPSEMAQQAGRLFTGLGNTLHIAARPLADNGPGSATDATRRYGEVVVDYVEVMVRYRRR